MASKPRTLRTFIWALPWVAVLVSSSFAQGPPLSSSQSFPEPRDKMSEKVTGMPEGGLAVGSWLFASRSSANSEIYRLNEFDGGSDLVGAVGRAGNGDLAFLPDGRLFGVNVCCFPGLTSRLLWINPRTGVGDHVGLSMGAQGVNALEADPNGRLYAASNFGEFLEVDVETGLATLIGPLGGDRVSLGDLAFDDEGTLFITVAVDPNFNAPVPSDLAIIDPATGIATEIGPTGFDDVFGLAFHPGVVLDIGGTEIRGPTLFGLTAGVIAGTVSQLIVIDRETGAGQLVATLSTDRMSGMAANIRWSPTQGEIDIVSFSGGDAGNQCAETPGQWTYCQHKRSPEHAPGVDGDETFAWDANLDSNGDAGEPVYAVAPGKVVSLYGETPPGGDDSNTVLVEHCLGLGPCDCQTTPTDCWWSGYRRMENIQVTDGQLVTPSNVLGHISNIGSEGVGDEHLHFSVYEGENRREEGQGLLTSVDAVLIPVPPIFSDGFESGDTSAWSSTVP